MGKAYPVELRERVIRAVLLGQSHRSVAKQFEVSVRFVNRMMICYKANKDIRPVKQACPVIGRYHAYLSFIKEQIGLKGDLTLQELCALVQSHFNQYTCQSGMWYALKSWGLSYKKNTASK